jgi:hypothetical protein
LLQRVILDSGANDSCVGFTYHEVSFDAERTLQKLPVVGPRDIYVASGIMRYVLDTDYNSQDLEC